MAVPSHIARRHLALLCIAALATLPACGGTATSSSDSPRDPAFSDEASATEQGTATVASAATGADFAPPAEVALPVYSGETPVDLQAVGQGYVYAAYQAEGRLKFQVSNGDMTYNYDLLSDGTPMAFPLNMGDGWYTFRIMLNTSDDNYVEVFSTGADVALASEFAPFLLPNLFCSYTDSSLCVAKAREITAGCANQGEAVRSVCEWVVANIAYDQDKAAQLAGGAGYVPYPDSTMVLGTGVCFDYASLTAAMLRSLGFPAKVVTGYVEPDDLYHAWVMVFADGSWQTAQFSLVPGAWSRMDVTFAATGGSGWTGNGTGYVDRYVY